MYSKKSMPPKRVGFLYNHDGLHQIAHTAPIIPALKRLAPDWEIKALVSSEAQATMLLKQLAETDTDLPIEFLQKSLLANTIQTLTGGIAPLGRLGTLSASRKQLSTFDALIVPETTTTALKTHLGLKNITLIHIPHGAGDRSIAVSPALGHFDYILLPGPKTRDRLLAKKLVTPSSHAVIGYPKFDSALIDKKQKFFDNDNPVVLYNPHFDPRLSSWFRFGRAVLAYFAARPNINLICAPHVMLFKRRILGSIEHGSIKIRRDIEKRYYEVPNIMIDTGSENSVNMAYTRSADIYLGDVSSQIYEFIEKPRPAIFLNSHKADWQNNPDYTFWTTGPVLDSMENFGKTLENCSPLPEPYRHQQQRLFEKTIDLKDTERSSDRAAKAIIAFLIEQEQKKP